MKSVQIFSTVLLISFFANGLLLSQNRNSSKHLNNFLNNDLSELHSFSKEVQDDGTIILNDEINISRSKILYLLGYGGSKYSYKLERESQSIFSKNRRFQFYQQYYKGIKVDGGSILLTLESQGKSTRICKIAPHLYTIEVNVDSYISKNKIKSLLKIEKDEFFECKLLISDVQNNTPQLVWDVYYSNQYGTHAQINAVSGQILKKENVAVSLSGNTRNYGQNVQINDFTNGGLTKLQTPDGGIKVYQGTNIGTGSTINIQQWNENLIPSTTSTTTWNGSAASPTAIQTLFVTNKVVDKYLEKLSIPFGSVNIAVEQTGAETLIGSTLSNSYFVIGNLFSNTPPDGPNFALYDVIAHELGHVNCFQYLDYDNDLNNRALHEGLADVFGTYIENYLKPGGTDWINANDDPEVAAFINRNYTIKVCLQNETSTPHARGKIVSHWFYSIAQGITEPGTNIPALGLEKSMNILTETLNLINYKKAGIEYFSYISLNVVANQFGVNSTEYEAVSKAWQRVCVSPACGMVQDLVVNNGDNITLDGSRTVGDIVVKNGGKLNLKSQIYVLLDKEIIVENGGELILFSCELVSCGTLQSWKGIKVKSGGILKIIGKTELDHAINAIEADDNSTVFIEAGLTVRGLNVSSSGITLNGNVNFNLVSTLDIENCKVGISVVNPQNVKFGAANKKVIKICPVGLRIKGGYIDIENFTLEDCKEGIKLESTTNLCYLRNNTIKGNFNTGVVAKNCAFNVLENNTIGSVVKRGFVGINSYGSINNIHANQIFAKQTCISSVESYVDIYKNYMFLENTSLWPLSQLRSAISLSTYDEGSNVENNIINVNKANYAINVGAGGKLYIKNNLIDFFTPSNHRPSVINTSGIVDGEISANIIHGSTAAGGIHVQNSMANAVECNDISGTGESMSVFYNSDLQTIKANTLSGTQDLVVRSVVGPQTHHGNKFNGGNTNALALTDDEVALSRFRVNKNIAGLKYMPSNPMPGNDRWFRHEDNPNASNCNGVLIGPEWELDPMRLCTYFVYLKSIIDSLPERFFINLYHLLKYEKLNPGFALPACIKQDSTLLHLCGLQKIVEISVALDTIGHHPSLIQNVKTLKDQYFNATDSLTKINLKQSIKIEWDHINLKLPAANIKDSLKLDSLENLLASVLCDSMLILKWKEIYKLYIKFKKTGTVSPMDTLLVKQYSSECADLYGDAIHLARVMASSFTDHNYAIYDDCIALPAPRSKIIGVAEESITAFPNPSTGIIQVKLPSQYTGHLGISDIHGRRISEQNINKSEFLTLDLTSNLGVNTLHFRSQNGIVQTIKIIVIQ
jgi:hypothetical protein